MVSLVRKWTPSLTSHWKTGPGHISYVPYWTKVNMFPKYSIFHLPAETLWNYLDVVWLNLLKRTLKVLCTLQVQEFVYLVIICRHLYCMTWSPAFLLCTTSKAMALWKYAHFSISKWHWPTKPYSIIMHLVSYLIPMPNDEVSATAIWQPLITHLSMPCSTKTTWSTWMKSRSSCFCVVVSQHQLLLCITLSDNSTYTQGCFIGV